MKLRSLLSTSLLLLGLLGSAGGVSAGHHGVYVAPPPLRHEPASGVRHGHVWVPGYWDWRSDRYHWVAGHWVRARPGYVYRPARWYVRDGRWYLDHGRWRRVRDRDGDGVPNRYDRHPNNPYRQ